MTIDPQVNLSRRAFAIGAAAATAGLTIGFRWASAQGPQAGPPVPAMIKDNPQLDAWVRVAPDGTVTVMTGRVELGQGILTAMRQVAAEELDVAPARLTLISGDTAQTPNEGVTAARWPSSSAARRSASPVPTHARRSLGSRRRRGAWSRKASKYRTG